jgi:hypothetical protein
MAGPAANFRQAAQVCLPGHPRLCIKEGVDARHEAGHDQMKIYQISRAAWEIQQRVALHLLLSSSLPGSTRQSILTVSEC